MKTHKECDFKTQGSLVFINKTIHYWQRKIDRLKDIKYEKNTPKQISTSAKKVAYMDVVHWLKQRKTDLLTEGDK